MVRIIDCSVNTADTLNAENARNLGLELDVRAAVQDLIGNEERVALKWKNGSKLERRAYNSWTALQTSLINQLMKNTKEAGAENYNLKSYLKMTQDFVQRMLKVQAHPATLFEQANPYRIIAVSKLIRELIKLQNSRFGKKLNPFERAILPTTMFAMRADAFGYVYKYAVRATNIHEDSRQAASHYKDRYNKIVSKYVRNIENALASVSFVTPEYIYRNRTINNLDDIDEDNPDIMEEGIKDMVTKNKRTVTYFGSIEKPDTRKVHLVFDQASGEKLEISNNMISRDSINKAIINKYSNEFLNDLMHGQTRHVTWQNTIRPEHKDKINEMFRKQKFKSTDAKDSAKGIPDLHYTEYPGMKVNYIVLKDNVIETIINGVKQVTSTGEERYSAYIISTQEEGKKKQSFYESRPLDKLRELGRNRFRNGFYRTQEYRTYGKTYVETRDKKGKVVNQSLSPISAERGWDFSGLNQKYMNSQPHPLLTAAKTTSKDRRMGRFDLWQTLDYLRTLYNDVGDNLKDRASEELNGVKEWLSEDGKLVQTMRKYMPNVTIQKSTSILRELFDINSRIWVAPSGEIHTPNSHFSKISQNYAPVIYEDSTVDEMLEGTIIDMEARLTDIPPNTKEYEELNRIIKEFKLTQARRNEPYMRAEVEALEAELEVVGTKTEASGVIAERNVHLKHRAQWTDLAKRKKTGDVHAQYLDTVYSSLQKNKLMNSMMETLNLLLNVNKGNFQQESFDWLVNRTKIAFNNPTSFGGYKGEKFTLDYSTQRVADFFNKFSKDRHWEPENAQNVLNWTKGFFGLSLLGFNVGLTNRTQIVNNAINWGWKAVQKSMRIVSGKDETFTKDMVDAIVDHAGTDEITNMFMDILAHGTDLSLKDAGMLDIPGIPFQIPTKTMGDFLLMLKNNRKGFIENGIPEIDKRLRLTDVSIRENQLRRIQWKQEEITKELAKNKISKAKFDLVMKPLEREEAKITDPEHKKTIRTLRELYLDLLTTPKTQSNRKLLESKFRRIMGDVTDKRMKRMVAWKLSWWWDGLAPEMFTMTEGERTMRKETVITAILTAMDSGVLGQVNWEKTKPYTFTDKKTGQVRHVEIPEALLSDSAIRIARNAVNNTMFGMSAIHLGEAFIGMGQHFGLYKAYPLQQMLHDYNTIKSWWSGGETTQENMVRLGKALKQATQRAVNKIEYDPNDDSIDHEALKVLRFITFRTGMTVVSVLLEMLSLFRWMFRSPMAKQFSYMIRGGENPAMAIGFRLLVNALIWSYFDDEDMFEGNMIEVGWDMVRLFFPVFLTLPLNVLADWVE